MDLGREQDLVFPQEQITQLPLVLVALEIRVLPQEQMEATPCFLLSLLLVAVAVAVMFQAKQETQAGLGVVVLRLLVQRSV